MFNRRFMTTGNIFLVLIIPSLLLSFVIAFLEKWMNEVLPEIWNGGSYLLVAFGALVFVAGYIALIAPRLNRLSSVSSKVISPDDYPPVKYMVTGYSPLNDTSVAQEFINKYPNIEQACAKDSDGPRLSWQQNLRTLNAANSKDTLEYIIVIEPSKNQTEEFTTLVKKYFPNVIIKAVHSSSNPDAPFRHTLPTGGTSQDYENFDYVTQATRRAFEICSQIEEKDRQDMENLVAVDVTAGLKIFSIAASIQSLDSRSVFFYAKSFENAGEVMAIDAAISMTGSMS